MVAVEFFLPTLPPSKNALYTVARGRMILTREYRSWKENAGKEIMVQRVRKIKGPYKITIQARKPNDLHRRDLGNILEATEDLLTTMQIIEDDHLSEDIHLLWDASVECGVNIRVEEAN